MTRNGKGFDCEQYPYLCLPQCNVKPRISIVLSPKLGSVNRNGTGHQNYDEIFSLLREQTRSESVEFHSSKRGHQHMVQKGHLKINHQHKPPLTWSITNEFIKHFETFWLNT